MPPEKSQPDSTEIIPAGVVESRIRVVRNTRVMLDFELAEVYGVTTAALNQAVDRNLQRFPSDFAFLLEVFEVAELTSQSVISRPSRGGRTKPPRAFTEQGVAMLSSVLRSETAVLVNIAIMRAFVRMRRLFATPGDIVTQLQQLAETVQLQDSQIKTIIDVLQKMVAPPVANPKRRIGFTNTTPDAPTEDKQ